MRIYQQLFPGHELKAQRFIDLNTTANATTMIRSPSFNKKGGSVMNESTTSITQH